MVREVARLVSDSTCSSVLLSDGVPLLSAAAADTTGAGGARMSMLGVTWNLPTVTGAGWTPVKPKRKYSPIPFKPKASVSEKSLKCAMKIN